MCDPRDKRTDDEREFDREVENLEDVLYKDPDDNEPKDPPLRD